MYGTEQILLTESALIFAQKLLANPKPAYSVKRDASRIAGSVPTAYRRLNALKLLGLAKSVRGNFILNTSVISQPYYLIEKLLPSLQALNKSRRFGRYYNDLDIKFAQNIPHRLTTLDYRAWELTHFQYPRDLYVYVQDVGSVAKYLKDNHFREGKNGRVALLPMIGEFDNEIQRVYYDCIANGGRSLQDAVAIELLHSDQLQIKGNFPIELVNKVQSDLPAKSKT